MKLALLLFCYWFGLVWLVVVLICRNYIGLSMLEAKVVAGEDGMNV